MGYAPRAILAGLLGLAAAFLVACGGGSGLLSSDQASDLNGQLDQVSSALSSGNCSRVSNATSGFANVVANLPSSVNSALRRNLTQGADRVAQLAQKQCQASTPPPSTTTTPKTTTQTTPKTTTQTTPTTPTNTNTTPTTPTSTTTTPATTSTPAGTTTTGQSGGVSPGGAGNGGGGGGAPGNGNGGNGQ
jgi:hypothetical protein